MMTKPILSLAAILVILALCRQATSMPLDDSAAHDGSTENLKVGYPDFRVRPPAEVRIGFGVEVR